MELAAALDYVREGDKLIVIRLDRLARGMGDLLEIAEQLRGKGVALQVLDPAMDTSTAAGELIFHVFGAVASCERKLMLERQREGIAKARVEGRYTGRKPTVRNQAETIRAMMAAGDGPTVIARKLKVARSSVYAALKASPCGMSGPIVAPDWPAGGCCGRYSSAGGVRSWLAALNQISKSAVAPVASDPPSPPVGPNPVAIAATHRWRR